LVSVIFRFLFMSIVFGLYRFPVALGVQLLKSFSSNSFIEINEGTIG
jgi:hypothetical protein